MFSTVRKELSENFKISYPFSKIPPRNVLEDFDPSFCSNPNVVFLGCTDMLNALHTIALSGNYENIETHLNDSSQSNIARCILVTYILTRPDFNPIKKEDIQYVWDVWYNTSWPEKTKMRFIRDVEELIESSIPNFIVIPKKKDFGILKEVWEEWLFFTSKEDTLSDLDKVQEERSVYIQEYLKLYPTEQSCQELQLQEPLNFSWAVDELTSQCVHTMSLDEVPVVMKKKITEEFRNYFLSGSCGSSPDNPRVCANPTLLEPKTGRWYVYSSFQPYQIFSLPLQINKLDPMAEDIVLSFCQDAFQEILIQHENYKFRTTYFFHVGDPLKFCYDVPDGKFHVVDCSNLADHVGLANLLIAANFKLSKSSSAYLLTQSTAWSSVGLTIAEYVETSLCTTLSMIPTLYGFKLKNNLMLGYSAPHKYSVSVDLRWETPPRYENVLLDVTPALEKFIAQLSGRCFSTTVDLTYYKEPCGMLYFTTLTFCFILKSLMERVPMVESAKDKLINNNLRISQDLVLSWRTWKTWVDGGSTLLFTRRVSGECYQVGSALDNPLLRLILVPKERPFNELTPFYLANFTHTISNIEVDLKKNPDGQAESVAVSFILVEDHGLVGPHSVILTDWNVKAIVCDFGTLHKFDCVTFDVRSPFQKSKAFPTSSSHEQLEIKGLSVKSMREFPDLYEVDIHIPTNKKSSGLEITTDQSKPCESAHEITIQLTHPKRLDPLRMRFSYPFLANEIGSSYNAADRNIRLVLRKSLNEPWPKEFKYTRRLYIDSLRPWEEADGAQPNNLFFHLHSQFDFESSWALDSKRPNSTLNQVRVILQTIFLNSALKGKCYFIIDRNASGAEATEPSWFLRIHLPMLTLPSGAPMLLMTAFDQELAERLVKGGKIKREDSRSLFLRFFSTVKKSSGMVKVYAFDQSDLQLLRFILRSNSTKIQPTPWQRTNVPLGRYTPWLATYISPLYIDNPANPSPPVECEEGQEHAHDSPRTPVTPGRDSYPARMFFGSNEDLLAGKTSATCSGPNTPTGASSGGCRRCAGGLKRCSKCQWRLFIKNLKGKSLSSGNLLTNPSGSSVCESSCERCKNSTMKRCSRCQWRHFLQVVKGAHLP